MEGKFVVFEGLDGSGKSTALQKTALLLMQQGYEVITTREPGGCREAEEIRAELLSRPHEPMEEAILFAKARMIHNEQKIIPAKREGKIILCDRYLHSSIAYQGYGRNLGADRVLELNKNALKPDMVLFIDVPSHELERRKSQREESNHLDRESMAFYARVEKGFMDFISEMKKIDGYNNPEMVALSCCNAIQQILPSKAKEPSNTLEHEHP